MTVYLPDGRKLTGKQESMYYKGLEVETNKSINKKAVALTGLTCLGIVTYISSAILAIALPESMLLEQIAFWVFVIPAGTVLFVIAAIIIGALFSIPIRAIYEFWDRKGKR